MRIIVACQQASVRDQIPLSHQAATQVPQASPCIEDLSTNPRRSSIKIWIALGLSDEELLYKADAAMEHCTCPNSADRVFCDGTGGT